MINDDFDLNKYLSEITDLADLYYVALIILSNLKSEDYSHIAELSILLDRSSFDNLLNYYQGESIKVPTKSEFKSVIESISIYYYYVLLEKTWYQTLSKLGISHKDKDESNRIWNNYKKLVESVKLANPKMHNELKRGHEDEF